MNPPDDQTRRTCPGVTAEQAAARHAGGALVLDVRQPEEWTHGHIDGAVLIPLPELADRLADVPTDRPIIVVCRSGNRSGIATIALRSAGIDAVNLDGGMQAWSQAGLATTSG